MRRRVRAVAVSAIVGFGALPATAQTSHPTAPHEVLSNGMDSCGEFLASSPQHQQVDAAWLLGYITGVDSRGTTASDRAVGTSYRDGAAVVAWVQEYCRSHALNYMVTAAEALRDEFAKREGRQ